MLTESLTIQKLYKRNIRTLRQLSLKKKDFTYSFLERGEGREKEGEKHQCMRDVASHTPQTGALVQNLGMYPDWGSNW